MADFQGYVVAPNEMPVFNKLYRTNFNGFVIPMTQTKTQVVQTRHIFKGLVNKYSVARLIREGAEPPKGPVNDISLNVLALDAKGLKFDPAGRKIFNSAVNRVYANTQIIGNSFTTVKDVGEYTTFTSYVKTAVGKYDLVQDITTVKISYDMTLKEIKITNLTPDVVEVMLVFAG